MGSFQRPCSRFHRCQWHFLHLNRCYRSPLIPAYPTLYLNDGVILLHLLFGVRPSVSFVLFSLYIQKIYNFRIIKKKFPIEKILTFQNFIHLFLLKITSFELFLKGSPMCIVRFQNISDWAVINVLFQWDSVKWEIQYLFTVDHVEAGKMGYFAVFQVLWPRPSLLFAVRIAQLIHDVGVSALNCCWVRGGLWWVLLNGIRFLIWTF